MKIDELASLGDEQLVHKELELERTMMGHTFRHRLQQLENTSVLKTTRRDIARTQTLLVAREHEAGLQRGVPQGSPSLHLRRRCARRFCWRCWR